MNKKVQNIKGKTNKKINSTNKTHKKIYTSSPTSNVHEKSKNQTLHIHQIVSK